MINTLADNKVLKTLIPPKIAKEYNILMADTQERDLDEFLRGISLCTPKAIVVVSGKLALAQDVVLERTCKLNNTEQSLFRSSLVCGGLGVGV